MLLTGPGSKSYFTSLFFNLMGVRRVFVFFTFLFISICVSGQTSKINNLVHKNMDTASCCYYARPRHYALLKMDDLAASKDTLHIRFWNKTQVIDIRTVDYKKFTGQIKNYVIKMDAEKWKNSDPNPEEFISNQVTLNRMQAKKIYKLMLLYDILIMPTDEKIPGWEKGFDGTTYFIEIATPLKYTFKSYWTPEAQGQLTEAVKLQKFVETLNKQLKLKNRFTRFTDTLPNGQYSTEGLGILTIKR